MSNQTWRKYGGMNKLEKMNNITVNSLVTDSFTVRDVASEFQIQALNVTGNSNLSGNIDISGSIYANSLDVLTNVILEEYLYFGLTNNIYFKGVSTNGVNKRLGLNTTSPESTLDIHGNSVGTLNVYTSELVNRNILAHNYDHNGIALYTDNSKSSIQFYNTGTTRQNQVGVLGTESYEIIYNNGKVVDLVGADNTNMISKLAISNDASPSHMFNETVVIYDTSGLELYPEAYSQYNQNVDAGNALSLVTQDNNSSTFLNITTPNDKGLHILGGVYSRDKDRSVGMITISNPQYGRETNPAQVIVGGKDTIKYPKTIGFNTYTPNADNCVLDINGPIQITNNDLKIVSEPTFEVFQIGYYKENVNYAIMVGSPYQIIPTTLFQVLYTHDGGITWNTSQLDPPGLSGTNNVFKGVYMVSLLNSVIVSSFSTGGYILYSTDSGVSYQQITGINQDFQSVFVNSSNRVYAGHRNGFTYFDFDFSNGTYTSLTTVTTDFDVLSICGNDTSYYAMGADKIRKYTHVSSAGEYDLNASYSKIRVKNNLIIAVGTNLISYSKDDGVRENWSHNTSITANFKDVFIYDENNAIAVGNNSSIYYTQDGYATWHNMTLNMLNSSGLGILLKNNLLISNIFMPDLDRFVVTTVNANTYPYYTTYYENVRSGQSNIIHVFIPNILNRAGNKVISATGNIDISGDIVIRDKGRFRSTNETFDFVNEDVRTLNIGGETNTLKLGGNDTSIMTFGGVNSTTMTFGGANTNTMTFGGTNTNTMTFGGDNTSDITMGGENSTNMTFGGANTSNVTVGGSATTLYLDGFIKDSIQSQDSSFNLLNENVATLNIGAQTSLINLGSASSTIRIDGTMDGALTFARITVLGDASMNSNLRLAENANIGGTLTVEQDVSMNSNLDVSSNITSNTLITEANATVNGTLFTDSVKPINDRIIVDGIVTIYDSVDISGSTVIDNNLTVSQNFNANNVTMNTTNIKENATFDKDVTIQQNLTVEMDFIHNGKITQF